MSTRASPAGQAFAVSSSRCGACDSSTWVLSEIIAGHRPTLWCSRAPGSGQVGSTSRTREAPTTQEA